jgi:hypothetical protein
MAWDPHDVGPLYLLSGDAPFDTLAGAVQKLRREYLERFGRNPYLAELVYTLCRLAECSSGLVEDASLPPVESVLSRFASPTPADYIDPGDYEAGIDAEDGDICIGRGRSGATVVRAAIDRTSAHEVCCRYSILTPDVSDAAARCLIRYCAMHWLLGIDILNRELVVRFERRS